MDTEGYPSVALSTKVENDEMSRSAKSGSRTITNEVGPTEKPLAISGVKPVANSNPETLNGAVAEENVGAAVMSTSSATAADPDAPLDQTNLVPDKPTIEKGLDPGVPPAFSFGHGMVSFKEPSSGDNVAHPNGSSPFSFMNKISELKDSNTASPVLSFSTKDGDKASNLACTYSHSVADVSGPNAGTVTNLRPESSSRSV